MGSEMCIRDRCSVVNSYILEALLGLLGAVLTIVIIVISVTAALRRNFVFRTECSKARDDCIELRKKDAELQKKDLEMRDKAIERLEKKLDDTHKELKGEICHVKRMVRAILTKMNISEVEVSKET